MKRIVPWIGVLLVGGAAAALIVLLCTTCLLGNHRFLEPTCTEPATCSRCGATRGDALGHVYDAATCETPATCTRCGEQNGEPLGHDFLPADCTEPEICTRCGATRGEPLGHSMTEATYQSASVCTRCGMVEGEPLPADQANATYTQMEVGKPYAYTTASYEDFDVDVTGTAQITAYYVFDGDETFPPRSGYEWHVATVQLVFSGSDAQQNGMQSALTFGDYYTTDAEIGAPADENGMRTFVVNYMGARVQCWQKTLPAEEGDWFGRELRFTWREGVLVPRGYDGTLLILYNYRAAKDADRLFLPADLVLNDQALVFRMVGKNESN